MKETPKDTCGCLHNRGYPSTAENDVLGGRTHLSLGFADLCFTDPSLSALGHLSVITDKADRITTHVAVSDDLFLAKMTGA